MQLDIEEVQSSQPSVVEETCFFTAIENKFINDKDTK